MGSKHARVYSQLCDVELQGIADLDEQRATRVATTQGTEALPTETLLERCDLVSVAVPTPHHDSVAHEAIDRGVGVLVEKPIATTPTAGARLHRAASEAGVAFQVGHVERFNPAIQTLLTVLQNCEPLAVDARRLGPPLQREIDDSVATDLMIHDADILLTIASGELTALQATGRPDGTYATATARFDDGLVGTLTASRRTQKKVRELSVTTEDCHITVDYLDQSVQIHRSSAPSFVEADDGVRYRQERVTERPTVENGEPLAAELRQFLDTVRTGSAPVVSGRDGVRALAFVREVDARIRSDGEARADTRPLEVSEP